MGNSSAKRKTIQDEQQGISSTEKLIRNNKNSSVVAMNQDEKLYTSVPTSEVTNISNEADYDCKLNVESYFRCNLSTCSSNAYGCGKKVEVCSKDAENTSFFRLSMTRQVYVAISVSLLSMVTGFSAGYTSPAIVSLEKEDIGMTAQEASWVGGIMPLAALLGGVVGGPLVEYLGRRKTMFYSALPFLLSWVLISAAWNIRAILFGRAIAGFCVGVASLTFPVYLGETIKPEVRGTLGLLPTALGNIGILVSFSAGTFLNWRWLAGLGAGICFCAFVLLYFIPETPSWYISKGKVHQALSSLEWLRPNEKNLGEVIMEMEEIHANSKSTDWKNGLENLFKARNLKPLLVCICLMLFQQMSGINAVIFYSVLIFRDAGCTFSHSLCEFNENLCATTIGVVNFLATFLATFLIDRIGRKILLYISSVMMILSLVVLSTFFYFQNLQVDMSPYSIAPLLSLGTFVLGFSLGFGPVPWLMMGEILPANIRGTGASVTTAFNWACTFIVTKSFTDIISFIGNDGVFGLFAAFCTLGLVFVIFCVPETKGRSLEDIETSASNYEQRKS